MIRKGSFVLLDVPDNPSLHGAWAGVIVVTEWGAHVLTRAAATGRFRALFSEMIPIPDPEDDNTPKPTGDVCGTCGSMSMVRTGTCLTCLNCGSTSGGCS